MVGRLLKPGVIDGLAARVHPALVAAPLEAFVGLAGTCGVVAAVVDWDDLGRLDSCLPGLDATWGILLTYGLVRLWVGLRRGCMREASAGAGMVSVMILVYGLAALVASAGEQGRMFTAFAACLVVCVTGRRLWWLSSLPTLERAVVEAAGPSSSPGEGGR